MHYGSAAITMISLVLYAGQFSWEEARAGDHATGYEMHDEDRARHAVENGEILPLDRVIARLRDAIPGDISGVELEKENGIWIYEFKVISPAGQMMTVKLDAKTGKQVGKAEK